MKRGLYTNLFISNVNNHMFVANKKKEWTRYKKNKIHNKFTVNKQFKNYIFGRIMPSMMMVTLRENLRNLKILVKYKNKLKIINRIQTNNK